MIIDDKKIIDLLESDEIDVKLKEHFEKNDEDFIKYASIKARYYEIKEANLEETPIEYLRKLSKSYPELEDLIPKTNKPNKFQNKTKGILNDIVQPSKISIEKNHRILKSSKYFSPFIPLVMVACILLAAILLTPKSYETEFYDFRYIDNYRSVDKKSIKMIDLKGYNKNEIIEFAQRNQFQISIINDGKVFFQKPSKNISFWPSKDTLIIKYEFD